MISGVVDADRREALIRLFVKSPAGMMHEIEAAVDTGFTEDLTLPPDLIAALGLPYVRDDFTRQSDGGLIQIQVHQASVLWDGQERSVEVQTAEDRPLIGMGLLLGHLLTMRTEDGGEVRIEPLP